MSAAEIQELKIQYNSLLVRAEEILRPSVEQVVKAQRLRDEAHEVWLSYRAKEAHLTEEINFETEAKQKEIDDRRGTRFGQPYE